MFKFRTLAKMRYVSRLGLIFTSLAILMIFLFSFYTRQVGGYTFELTDPSIGNKGMILSDNKEFINPTDALYAEPKNKAWPIGVINNPEAIPIEITSIETFKDGSDNGLNYFAYTFYVKNVGIEDLDYNIKLYITEAERNIEKAIRIMIIHTKDYFGEKIKEEGVYAQLQSEKGTNPNTPEPGSIPFYNGNIVINQNRFDFEVDMVDQFTVIMWLHGEDPDCTDVGEESIIEGKLSMTMKLSILA
ncbi:MAG TPA: hypothetical protein VIK94_01555 [Bacilli bacterium]